MVAGTTLALIEVISLSGTEIANGSFLTNSSSNNLLAQNSSQVDQFVKVIQIKR